MSIFIHFHKSAYSYSAMKRKNIESRTIFLTNYTMEQKKLWLFFGTRRFSKISSASVWWFRRRSIGNLKRTVVSNDESGAYNYNLGIPNKFKKCSMEKKKNNTNTVRRAPFGFFFIFKRNIRHSGLSIRLLSNVLNRCDVQQWIPRRRENPISFRLYISTRKTNNVIVDKNGFSHRISCL